MKGEHKSRGKTLRIILSVLAALFAAGAAACVICYVVYKNGALFIPMAVCLVFALILFTYARNNRE